MIRCIELRSIQLQQRRQPVVSAFRSTKAHGECVVRSRREVFVPRPDSTEVLFPSQLITTCSCLQQCHFSPDRNPLLRTPKAAVKRNSSTGSFAVDNQERPGMASDQPMYSLAQKSMTIGRGGMRSTNPYVAAEATRYAPGCDARCPCSSRRYFSFGYFNNAAMEIIVLLNMSLEKILGTRRKHHVVG